MTNCPIPVDWLDLLEGRPSVAEHAHLNGCPSCAAVVAALSRDSSVSEPLAVSRIVGREVTAARRLPQPPAFDTAEVGQLWWTVEVPDADARLAVLLIGTEEEGSVDWFNAVPLRPNDGLGTSTDVLFLSDDTSTGLDWLALFRSEFVLSQAQLDSPIGELAESGARLLNDILAGYGPITRSGNLIESEDDPRLGVDEWISVAARILASEYASIGEGQEEAETERAARPLLVLTVSRQAAPKDQVPHQLAAATSSSALLWVRVTGADTRIGAHVDGWLRLNERGKHEELVFEIKEARGIPGRVPIVLYTKVRQEAIVTEAELTPGSYVILGADLGISEFDIERVEIGSG
jgi:hypothetical protein